MAKYEIVALEKTVTNLTLICDNIRYIFESNKLDLNLNDFRHGNLRTLKGANKISCGTTCCVLGATPMIPGLEMIPDDLVWDVPDFLKYSNRILPWLDINSHQWSHLFNHANSNDLEAFICRAYSVLANLKSRLVAVTRSKE